MDNKNTQHSVGTLCFLPDGDIKTVLLTVEKLCLNLNEHWRILIVTSASQRSEKGFAEINKICRKLPFLDHLIVKEGQENQVVCPTVIKVINAIQYVKTRYISFVDGRHLPQIVNLTNVKRTMDQNIDLGGLRGSISALDPKKIESEYMFKSQIFDSGKGINQFGLSGLSPIGIVYNVPFLLESGILMLLQKNARTYFDAPRVSFYSSSFTYLNILVASHGRTGLSSQVVCEVLETELSDPKKVSQYFSWRSFGQRCDQVIALRNTLFEGFVERKLTASEQTLKSDLFYSSYIKLCSQLLTLIVNSNKDCFFDQMMGIELIARSYFMFCIGALQEFPDFKKFEAEINKSILSKIDSLLKNIEPRQFLPLEESTNNGLPTFYSN